MHQRLILMLSYAAFGVAFIVHRMVPMTSRQLLNINP